MSELLDTIDDSLQEVEEQLLQEFDRIRNTLSDARFEAIDLGIKNALASVVAELKDRLEQTGDSSNLSLMTERHEVLYARMAVLRQLLNAKVPTAFLHEAHREVSSNRRKLEAEVTARRRQQQASGSEDDADKGGFVSKLKGMFGGSKPTEKAVSRNRIRVTEEEQKALEPVSIYLDNGIYSASRELAALANVFSLPQQQRDDMQDAHERKMRAVISGKAHFDSKDLSAKPEQALDAPDSIAQTPDEIRRKLAERSGNRGGASSFAAKDLSSAPPPGTRESGSIAQTPEEIRRKLAERGDSDKGKASFSSRDIAHEEAVNTPNRPPREKSAAELAAERKAALEAEKAKAPTTGKASFVSKDIEPVVPQEAPRRRPTKPEIEEPAKPTTGKAVFESRDLSNPPPGGKR